MRLARAIALAVLAPCLAAAQDEPADYRYSAPLELDGVASHYRFSLPAHAYRGAERRDHADLRVFNAAGEPVPHAFAPREIERPAGRSRSVNLFPLHGDRAKGVEGTTVRVERTASGSVVNVSVTNAPAVGRRTLLGYLVDAAEIKSPHKALVLDWRASAGFSGAVRVEASDDLKGWRTLASGAPLLRLEHAGARLEHRRVELGGAHARYLRLSFSGVPRDFSLTEARIEEPAARPEPVRDWLTLTAVEGKERGELQFDMEGVFPVDRLKLHLPQPNTVVRLELFARRHPAEKWRPVTTATAYRLARESGADIVSPDIAVPALRERYWMARIDPKGGGIGADSMQIEAGWVPHEVVFVARGAAPFRLAYGNRDAKPGALPAATLLPQEDGRQLAQAKLARVGEAAAAAPASAFGAPGRFLRELADNRDLKKWLLWAALVAGVLLLAAMALRLLRSLESR
jgi:hypothetical protein